MAEHDRGDEEQPSELLVISPLKDWTCTDCGGSGGFLKMEAAGPVCMECADMGHLVFLPRGDAALTRRARRHSRLSAVVVRFSQARRRYERQGVLIEEPALARAEAECLADESARARRRERSRAERAVSDERLERAMADEIRRLFPGCPADRAAEVARHTALRGSGRVGRTAAGRALDPSVLELAVRASVRHRDTRYDELLMSGEGRGAARQVVHGEVEQILDSWRGPGA